MMFTRKASPERCTVVDADTRCQPELALRFFTDQRLVGPDRRAAIVNLIAWSRRLYHFLGGPEARAF